MKRSRRYNSLTREGARVKSRVSQTRYRAQFVGIIYLLSIILLAVVACFPLFDLDVQENVPVGITMFWKELSSAGANGRLRLGIAAIYGVMLLVVLVNALRALGKLSWLFKQKVSKTYGLNRNVYAMEDLGKIFSTSFSVIFIAYYVIAIVCGQSYPNKLMYLTIAVGLFVHFFAGIIGGKASYFTINAGTISEEARIVGRLSAFIRNVLQVITVFLMMIYLKEISVLHTVISPIFEANGFKTYVLGEPTAFLSIVCQGLCVACFVPLTFHAFGTTEYNIDGVHGSGMKTFRVFTFLVALIAGIAIASEYYIGQVVFSTAEGATSMEVVKALNNGMVIFAGIAFVMFMIEVIMRKMPGYKEEDKEDDDDDDEDDDDDDEDCNCQYRPAGGPPVVVHIYNE